MVPHVRAALKCMVVGMKYCCCTTSGLSSTSSQKAESSRTPALSRGACNGIRGLPPLSLSQEKVSHLVPWSRGIHVTAYVRSRHQQQRELSTLLRRGAFSQVSTGIRASASGARGKIRAHGAGAASQGLQGTQMGPGDSGDRVGELGFCLVSVMAVLLPLGSSAGASSSNSQDSLPASSWGQSCCTLQRSRCRLRTRALLPDRLLFLPLQQP